MMTRASIPKFLALLLGLGRALAGKGAPPSAAPPPSPPSAEEACCWCDPDTPAASRVTVDAAGAEHSLVFSDEFEQEGRDLSNGQDKRWTAIDKSDYTNASPLRYTPAAVTTVRDLGAYVLANASDPSSEARVFRPYARPRGSLRLETDRIVDKAFAKAVNKSYTGGMVQSWDKFCFTGGVVEVSAKFPMGLGFWPALWLFGNLGRAIHEESNDGLWPYSFDACDPAHEARYVPPPGKPQRISACDPSPGPGLHAFQGRGATEIDLVEVGDSWNGLAGWAMQSLQLAPAIPDHFRPKLHDPPQGYALDPQSGRAVWESPAQGESSKDTWYRGLRFGGNTSAVPPVLPNAHWYGPKFADSLTVRAPPSRAAPTRAAPSRAVAASAPAPHALPPPRATPPVSQAGISPFRDLSEVYRTLRLEWLEGTGGHLRWYIDGAFVFEIPAEALGAYSVCAQTPDDAEPVCESVPARLMPSEPMSLVLNTALGSWNGGPQATNGHLPGHMLVDSVRVWQRKDRTNVGCDPPDFPTKAFIDANARLYGEPAQPRGYESCPQAYPQPSSRPERGGQGGLAARAKPSGSFVLGFVMLSIAGIALLVAAYSAVAARVRARRGASAASQYGDVGDAAGASREPMLR